jgi:hypothetical protein
VLLQIVTFLLLAIYFHRARGRIATLVKEDESMARGARVFEVPVSAAAVVTLIGPITFVECETTHESASANRASEEKRVQE